MSCEKEGACVEDVSKWCNGYTCRQGSIVKDDTKRDLNQMCNKSEDCSSSYCNKPDCSVLSSLGVSREICSGMGICDVKPS